MTNEMAELTENWHSGQITSKTGAGRYIFILNEMPL